MKKFCVKCVKRSTCQNICEKLDQYLRKNIEAYRDYGLGANGSIEGDYLEPKESSEDIIEEGSNDRDTQDWYNNRGNFKIKNLTLTPKEKKKLEEYTSGRR